ncbi:MAG TPA: toxin TcdB middle/N-terminal domain-containing protein, partial [Candidatus Nanopelagicales bacterium]|nr:toxin TcdB middle/N-terminal domain-containing protein [Candidatus Nanopelagicales bacterium]
PAILVHLARGPAGFAPPIQISAEPGTLHWMDGWITSQVGDFNGDGLADVVLIHKGRLRVLQQRPAQVDVVTKVWDDVPTLGARERVMYSHAWSDAPRAVTCAYPQRCLRHGLQVVREHSVSQGEAVASLYRREYSYEDPRVDLRGRGFLGFGEVRVWDTARFSQTITTYDHETSIDGIYPHAGLPERVLHIAPILRLSSPPIVPTFTARVTEVTRTHALRRLHQDQTYFVPLSRWQSKEWEEQAEFAPERIRLLESPNVTLLRFRSGTETHDDYGNLLSSVEETQGGVRRELSIEYTNATGLWLIGLAHKVATRSFEAGTTPPEPRRVGMQYDNLGRLWRVSVEPLAGTDPDLQSVATVTRSFDGLITSITSSAPGVPDRHVYIAYDDTERMFPEVTWNDLGHAAWVRHHPALGEVVRAVDMNAVETRRWFDGFGRLRRERRDGAGEIEVVHEERASNGQVIGVVERITADDGSEHVTEYDELGRVVEEAVRGFDGAWSVRAVGYDELGRVSRVHRPAFGGPGPATQIEHDALGRVLEVIAPDGA